MSICWLCHKYNCLAVLDFHMLPDWELAQKLCCYSLRVVHGLLLMYGWWSIYFQQYYPFWIWHWFLVSRSSCCFYFIFNAGLRQESKWPEWRKLFTGLDKGPQVKAFYYIQYSLASSQTQNWDKYSSSMSRSYSTCKTCLLKGLFSSITQDQDWMSLLCLHFHFLN